MWRFGYAHRKIECFSSLELVFFAIVFLFPPIPVYSLISIILQWLIHLGLAFSSIWRSMRLLLEALMFEQNLHRVRQ